MNNRNCHQAAMTGDRITDDGIQIQMDSEQTDLNTGVDFLSLYTLGSGSKRPHEPVLVELFLNERSVVMEVDTGAAVTVMGEPQFKKLGNVGKLKPTFVKLKTYTGQVVKPKGEGELDVRYGSQVFKLPILVLAEDVPTLLGRNWLRKIKLEYLVKRKLQKMIRDF